MVTLLKGIYGAIAVPALVAVWLFAFGSQTLAQTPPTRVGVRGTITEVSPELLKVHTTRGADLAVVTNKDTKVLGISAAKISDIKSGAYIGTAAAPQPDGTLKALEVHVFPPAMAGTGDGHRPWDLVKDSTMTNGAVGDVVVSNGRTITVKYKDGEKKIVVPEDVPIVAFEPGDATLLKAGAHVVMFATKGADGTLSTASVLVGKNGVIPPM